MGLEKGAGAAEIPNLLANRDAADRGSVTA
jgi:hypothetical protein